MEQKLKTYQIHLKVNGPVFVGDGNEIQKKEYMFLNRNTIGGNRWRKVLYVG